MTIDAAIVAAVDEESALPEALRQLVVALPRGGKGETGFRVVGKDLNRIGQRAARLVPDWVEELDDDDVLRAVGGGHHESGIRRIVGREPKSFEKCGRGGESEDALGPVAEVDGLRVGAIERQREVAFLAIQGYDRSAGERLHEEKLGRLGTSTLMHRVRELIRHRRGVLSDCEASARHAKRGCRDPCGTLAESRPTTGAMRRQPSRDSIELMRVHRFSLIPKLSRFVGDGFPHHNAQLDGR